MSEETLNRDARINDAIEYFHANQADPDRIPLRQIALRFDISYSTLSRRLHNKTSSISLLGGHNKVFSKAQSDALLAYITDKAYIGSLCTYSIIIEAIGIIKDASLEARPLNSFIQKYIKGLPIKKIKWKLMDYKRPSAQDIDVIIDWFRGFAEIKEKYNIKPYNIYNFNECSFRVACLGAINVYVPSEIEVVRLYIFNYINIKLIIKYRDFFDSYENRKLKTLIETISTTSEVLPLYLIMTRKRQIDYV